MYIYGLIDPRDGMFRWVGSTMNMNNRYSGHCAVCANPRSSRDFWVEELRLMDQRPIMVLLEVVPPKQAMWAEDKWYLRLNDKHPLLNQKRPLYQYLWDMEEYERKRARYAEQSRLCRSKRTRK